MLGARKTMGYELIRALQTVDVEAGMYVSYIVLKETMATCGEELFTPASLAPVPSLTWMVFHTETCPGPRDGEAELVCDYSACLHAWPPQRRRTAAKGRASAGVSGQVVARRIVATGEYIHVQDGGVTPKIHPCQATAVRERILPDAGDRITADCVRDGHRTAGTGISRCGEFAATRRASELGLHDGG
jgi:hypothetical protein